MKKWLLIGGGAVLLLLSIVVGALFAGPLFASANTNTPAAGTPTATKNQYCDLFEQSLAKRLGVSVTTLQQDRQGAFGDVLAQLVKDGKLTQAQADQITKRLAAHPLMDCSGLKAGRFVNFASGQFLKKYRTAIFSEVAQGLKLTPAQLKAQLKSGQSLNDIAQAQHVSQTDLRNLLSKAITDELSKAVSAGDLTQSQATAYQQMLQQHPQMLDKLLNQHFGKAKK
ncbi:MAG TPA: hypothetical protein VFB60_20810 [Ktedonobacteraceae bacterium]|nr:hypothetical protein [Ktedonobacteraceae bacterium]